MIYKIEFTKTRNTMMITAENLKDLHKRIISSYGNHDYVVLEQISEKTIEEKELLKNNNKTSR